MLSASGHITVRRRPAAGDKGAKPWFSTYAAGIAYRSGNETGEQYYDIVFCVFPNIVKTYIYLYEFESQSELESFADVIVNNAPDSFTQTAQDIIDTANNTTGQYRYRADLSDFSQSAINNIGIALGSYVVDYDILVENEDEGLFYRCRVSYPATQTHAPTHKSSTSYWEYLEGYELVVADMLLANRAFINFLAANSAFIARLNAQNLVAKEIRTPDTDETGRQIPYIHIHRGIIEAFGTNTKVVDGVVTRIANVFIGIDESEGTGIAKIILRDKNGEDTFSVDGENGLKALQQATTYTAETWDLAAEKTLYLGDMESDSPNAIPLSAFDYTNDFLAPYMYLHTSRTGSSIKEIYRYHSGFTTTVNQTTQTVTKVLDYPSDDKAYYYDTDHATSPKVGSDSTYTHLILMYGCDEGILPQSATASVLAGIKAYVLCLVQDGEIIGRKYVYYDTNWGGLSEPNGNPKTYDLNFY